MEMAVIVFAIYFVMAIVSPVRCTRAARDEHAETKDEVPAVEGQEPVNIFFKKFVKLEKDVREYLRQKDLYVPIPSAPNILYPFRQMVNAYYQNEIISADLKNDFSKVNKFRNLICHNCGGQKGREHMRKFFFLPLAIAFAGCLCTPAYGTSSMAQKPIELSFSFHAPMQSSLVKAILLPWKEKIETGCGGRVKIVLYPGGALLSSSAEYDGVVSGICDIAQIYTEAYPGRFPLSEIHTLPFAYPNIETAGIVSHELTNRFCADTEFREVKVLISATMLPAHYFGNKPVEKLADFSGLKIRAIGSLAADIYSTLGATPVNIMTSDMFSALDRGVIDGITYSWAGAIAFGVADITKYRTQMALSGGVHFFVMNRDSFDRLPPDIKKIFNEICTPAYSGELAAAHLKYAQEAQKALADRDKKAGNPPICVPSAQELERWKKALQPLEDKWVSDRGPIGKEMMDTAKLLMKQYSKQSY